MRNKRMKSLSRKKNENSKQSELKSKDMNINSASFMRFEIRKIDSKDSFNNSDPRNKDKADKYAC